MMTSSPFGVSPAASTAVLAPIPVTTTAVAPRATITTSVMSPAKKQRVGLWIGFGIAIGAIGAGVGVLVLRR